MYIHTYQHEESSEARRLGLAHHPCRTCQSPWSWRATSRRRRSLPFEARTPSLYTPYATHVTNNVALVHEWLLLCRFALRRLLQKSPTKAVLCCQNDLTISWSLSMLRLPPGEYLIASIELRIWICIHIYRSVCVCVNIYIYIYTYIHTYIYTHIYIYTYIYTYMSIHTSMKRA